MFTVEGKYNQAKIFADEEQVDAKAVSQVRELCNQAFAEGSRIRLMPDLHAGKGCTIGTTMTVKDRIVPNLVGVDIGCGMETVKLKNRDIDFRGLNNVIQKKIPCATAIRKEAHPLLCRINLENLRCREHVDLKRAALSLGTLGGGNHFIEVNADDEGNLYLVIHSGSRHLGLETAEYYQEQGIADLRAKADAAREELITKLKADGRGEEIETELAKLNEAWAIPDALCYAEGQLFDDYVHDMKIVQYFAQLNRQAMVEVILKMSGLEASEAFSTIHNYLDTEALILRKGAVSAKLGEKLLIPINMRDGSLICEGLGNEDWNFSAPHGAGRLFSRTAAKKAFTVREFKESMKGIYSSSIGRGTIDECPMVYKSKEMILKHLSPTVKVLKTLKPVYNFKAH